MNGAVVELVFFAGLLIVMWRYTRRLERENAARRQAKADAERQAAPAPAPAPDAPPPP
jgi:hypothetical protein